MGGKLIAVIMVALVGPAQLVPAHAQLGWPASRPIAVSRTVDHLKLTMSVSRRDQPQNALIRVRMTVTNLSHHAVRIERSSCDRDPSINVLDTAGNTLFPPALPALAALPCGPVISPSVLPAGHLLTRSMLVILRGPTLQMALDVVEGHGGRSLLGPSLTFSLASASAPVASLQTGGQVSISITPSPGAHGKMRYQAIWGCDTTDGNTEVWFAGKRVWSAKARPRLTRAWSGDCGSRRWWHVVAGWLGHPVVYVNYGLDPLAHLATPHPGTLLYQADRQHGWAGWRASGWSVQNGLLTSDGSQGEIRAPYIPGRHRIRNYQVVVMIASLSTVSPSQTGSVSIRLRRAGERGYALEARGCDYTPCLLLRRIPGVGLNEVGADSGDAMVPGTILTFRVVGSRLSGSRSDPSETLYVHARDHTLRAGGFVSIFAPKGERVQIAKVVIREER